MSDPFVHAITATKHQCACSWRFGNFLRTAPTLRPAEVSPQSVPPAAQFERESPFSHCRTRGRLRRTRGGLCDCHCHSREVGPVPPGIPGEYRVRQPGDAPLSGVLSFHRRGPVFEVEAAISSGSDVTSSTTTVGSFMVLSPSIEDSKEVASVAGLPLVMLLDQDSSSEGKEGLVERRRPSQQLLGAIARA